MQRTSWVVGVGFVVGVLGLGGCAGDGRAGPPPDAPREVRLVVDGPGEGASLWLDGRLDGSGVELEVWAKDLGEVFGYAAHVELAGDALAVDPGGAFALDGDALASGDPAAHHALVTSGPGDIGFGECRASLAAGAVEVAAPVRLGTVRLRLGEAREGSIRLTRISVRRADGSFVEVTAGAARLVEEEV
jgi:hypothetical protein